MNTPPMPDPTIPAPTAVSDAEVRNSISDVWRSIEQRDNPEGVFEVLEQKVEALLRDRQTAEARSAAGAEAERESCITEAEKLIERAYNAGFIEGMREHTSSRGGIPWTDSAMKKIGASALRDRPLASTFEALASLLAAARADERKKVNEEYQTFVTDAVAAMQAITDLDVLEINPSNYDHDDVCNLNRDAVQAWTIANAWLCGLPTPPAGGASDAPQE